MPCFRVPIFSNNDIICSLKVKHGVPTCDIRVVAGNIGKKKSFQTQALRSDAPNAADAPWQRIRLPDDACQRTHRSDAGGQGVVRPDAAATACAH
jgi:hypothetical protein